jgi:hypothetical protein
MSMPPCLEASSREKGELKTGYPEYGGDEKVVSIFAIRRSEELNLLSRYLKYDE